MASILRDVRADVLHTHQVGALAYAGPASRASIRAPIVHTEHGKHYASRFRTRLLGRLAGRFVDRFVCVSGDIAKEVERHRIVSPSRICVVPNGIDTGRFGDGPGRGAAREALGIPANALLVGTVGRLNEVKRQDRLIRAFARIVGDLADAHLLLVGDGPLMGESCAS